MLKSWRRGNAGAKRRDLKLKRPFVLLRHVIGVRPVRVVIANRNFNSGLFVVVCCLCLLHAVSCPQTETCGCNKSHKSSSLPVNSLPL